MTYELLWSVSFDTLRESGFRPLRRSAWAGVKTQDEFDRAREKAKRMGLSIMVPVTRQDIHGFYDYSCDLSTVRDVDLGFKWSYVPYLQLTDQERATGKNNRKIESSRVAGYAFFANERDAVAWKLSVLG